ncbi:hypothetical protein MKX01_031878 [Papaver californicum]|nr:hypothetical protein MKX01_031878 [Papaver californicum]
MDSIPSPPFFSFHSLYDFIFFLDFFNPSVRSTRLFHVSKLSRSPVNQQRSRSTPKIASQITLGLPNAGTSDGQYRLNCFRSLDEGNTESVVVRVTRKWEELDFMFTHDVTSVDLVIVDAQAGYGTVASQSMHGYLSGYNDLLHHCFAVVMLLFC